MLPLWFGDITTCPKLLDGARLEDSEWDQGNKEQDTFPVQVKVTAWLEKGLGRDQKTMINRRASNGLVRVTKHAYEGGQESERA